MGNHTVAEHSGTLGRNKKNWTIYIYTYNHLAESQNPYTKWKTLDFPKRAHAVRLHAYKLLEEAKLTHGGKNQVFAS